MARREDPARGAGGAASGRGLRGAALRAPAVRELDPQPAPVVPISLATGANLSRPPPGLDEHQVLSGRYCWNCATFDDACARYTLKQLKPPFREFEAVLCPGCVLRVGGTPKAAIAGKP